MVEKNESGKIILNEQQELIAKNRYFFNNEDWQGLSIRVGSLMSMVENQQKLYQEKFSEIIYDMDFLPGGRILRNAGRPRGSLFNCYHLPIGDSREEIGQFLKDSLILWGEGGGVGANFSNLRPKGSPIHGVGGKSSGVVSFIKAADAVAKTIESGGQRRAAALASLDVSHPEILDFINAKTKDKVISSFNISVQVNSEFLEAVESNKDWEFRFKQKSFGKIPAREIWDKIIHNMVNCGEPGLLNMTNFLKNNSYYYDPVIGTNPCLTGDSLISVADGREFVDFKTLSEEGKDVPVYCLNNETNEIEIKVMRNPRKTGTRKRILKLTMDDGSVWRGTENHKIRTFSGEMVEAEKLKVNDRLNHCLIQEDTFIGKRYNDDNNRKYKFFLNKSKRFAEHRLLYEFKENRKLKKGEIVHHIDNNSLNNVITNLELHNNNEHKSLHAKDLENNFLVNQDASGENNGMFGKHHSEESRKLISQQISKKFREDPEYKKKCSIGMKKFYEKNGTDFLKGERVERIKIKCSYCKEDQLITPGYFNELNKNKKEFFCSKSCSNRGRYKNDKDNINYYFENDELIEIGKKYLNETGKKKCTFNEWDRWRNSKEERIPTAQLIIGKFGGFDIFNEKIEEGSLAELNFRIAKIEFDGFEDVYNGTVDDNHNYFIHMSDSIDDFGVKTKNILNVANCGETCLESYGICNLGSLNLPNFITGTRNTNWKKLEEIIKLGVRFLDNVIDVNKYTLNECSIKAQNSRRIGIGVMGLAEYLFAKKIRYGSKESIQEIEKLFRSIRDSIYESSVELSMEKGAFQKFDPVQYGKASFIRKLPAQLRRSIKDHGCRNVTMMAIAPTGTISQLAGVSSGIEPLVSKVYLKSDRVSDRLIAHPLFMKLKENKEEIPDWFVDIHNLKPEDHLEVQAIVQKYVDNSVSKTINMPADTTIEQVDKLLLEYIHDLKGVTIYVDKSRSEQVNYYLTKEQINNYLKGNVEVMDIIDTVKCSNGKCDL